jgi:hypothetical protein
MNLWRPLAAAGLLLASGADAASPAWTPVGSTSLGANFADFASVRRTAGGVHVNTLFNAKRAAALEGNPARYRSIVAEVVIDCTASAYAIRRLRYHAGSGGRGAVVEDFVDDTLTVLGSTPLRAGWPMHGLARKVCVRRSGSAAGSATR